jgi:hypothetical protein
MKCYLLDGNDEILLAARNPGHSRGCVAAISVRTRSVSRGPELARSGIHERAMGQ